MDNPNERKKKIFLLKGLPASGKSTWSKEQVKNFPTRYKRISKDDLRIMVDDGVWSKTNERFILKLRDAFIREALAAGFDPIIDDTNFAMVHEEHMRAIASEFPNTEVVIEFFNTPLTDCIERDRKRQNSVGRGVIMKMWRQYLKPQPIPHQPNLPDACIIDIDGTLALFGDKNPYERDFINDAINVPVLTLIHGLQKAGYRIIIVSGRKDIYQDVTEEWLHKFLEYDELYMRKTQPEGVQEPPDVLVKQTIYETYIKDKFNIFCVVDDRPRVITYWRSLGLSVFDVGDGVDF